LRSKIKTHGLATTGGEMMESIDWRSVDSARWMWQARNGSVSIEWQGQLKTLRISERTSWPRGFAAHFDAGVDDHLFKRVDEICAELSDERFTLTPDMLGNRDAYCYLFNAHVMTQWSKRPHARDKLA
jgi:hypothetical protein